MNNDNFFKEMSRIGDEIRKDAEKQAKLDAIPKQWSRTEILELIEERLDRLKPRISTDEDF